MFGGIRVLRRGKSQERIHVGELQTQIERTRARVRPRCESVPRQGKGGAQKKTKKKTYVKQTRVSRRLWGEIGRLDGEA